MKCVQTVLKALPLFIAVLFLLFAFAGVLGLDGTFPYTYAMAQMLLMLAALVGFSEATAVLLLLLVLFLYLFPLAALLLQRKKRHFRLLIGASLLFLLDAVWAGILLAVAGSPESVFVLILDLAAFVGCLLCLKDKRS